MVFYIVSPYVLPPKHHSSTNDSNRESGVQVAVAITSPQVLNTCPCRRGWGEMKPRKYTIWEHPTINWWFLKSSSLFVSSCYFQFKDLLPPPPKKKNETMIKAKPAPAVQEEPHPGKCDACEAAPCDRDGRSFFRDGSQRGKGVLPTFHKGRTMKTEVRLAKLSGLLGWTEEKKTREKLGTPLTFRKLGNNFWCMFKIPKGSTPSHEN